MQQEFMDLETSRLIEIGKIMDSIGISSVELAERLKEHVMGCSGGKSCLDKLVKNTD